MVQRGKDFVRRRTGQELLHTKAHASGYSGCVGFFRSSLISCFAVVQSFLLDDRLQAAGNAVDFAVSAFVGSEVWSVIIKVKSPNARKGDKIITLRRDSKWENGIQARNAGRR